MSRKNTVPTRVDATFKKYLDEIRMTRFRSGKDKQPLPMSRLTLAITRVPKLKELLEESKIGP